MKGQKNAIIGSIIENDSEFGCQVSGLVKGGSLTGSIMENLMLNLEFEGGLGS
jgi:hypothetical protein